MSRPITRLNHPALMTRIAGTTGALFTLAIGLSWAHLHAWPTPVTALTVIVLALAAGQVLGAGWADKPAADLAAAGLLVTIGAAATVRAAIVGVHSVMLELTAAMMLGAIVAACVYGREALARLRSAVR